MSIPRKLLDMFLDYSITNRFFEKKEEQVLFEPKQFNRKFNPVVNKFDSYSPDAPEFEYYFKNRYRYENRIEDLNKVYSQLKLDAKPYIPKRIQNQNSGENLDQKLSPDQNEIKKSPLSGIDPSKVKEYVPKNFRIIKLDEKEKEVEKK